MCCATDGDAKSSAAGMGVVHVADSTGDKIACPTLVVMVLLGVSHVHRIIAVNFGVLALGAAQVGFAGGFRTDGEARNLLLQASALALGASGCRLEHQRFELLTAIQAMKVV